MTGDEDREVSPTRVLDAKDELNLAEFPLCAIADRLPPGQKSLSFEDRVWDSARGEMVVRQLTITGSEEFGLPTALDDEVLLGLIQLSKLQHFSDRKVHFTRYQFLRLLSWADESKNYERLEKSLNRWVGVTLYYQNAWWDRGEQNWASEKFHILDNVTLYERERVRQQKKSGRQSQLPLSTFVWNDVVFRSFQAGNLKSIDFDFFKRLESSVAKRLYRFLDKRFFHRSRWEFDLKELCWEHVGLSRNYSDAANLKRKLKTGIGELERQGFLVALPDTQRFLKVKSGEWRVVFEKACAGSIREKSAPPPPVDVDALCEGLIRRGVSPTAAREAVAGQPPERVRSQLEVFDWLVAQKHRSVSVNPAGFLISSIRSDYAPPKEFLSEAERVKRKEQAAARRAREEEKAREAMAQEEQKRIAREKIVKQFWQSCSALERRRMEDEALNGASSVERAVLERGGTFAVATRQALFDAFALKSLEQGV